MLERPPTELGVLALKAFELFKPLRVAHFIRACEDAKITLPTFDADLQFVETDYCSSLVKDGWPFGITRKIIKQAGLLVEYCAGLDPNNFATFERNVGMARYISSQGHVTYLWYDIDHEVVCRLEYDHCGNVLE